VKVKNQGTRRDFGGRGGLGQIVRAPEKPSEACGNQITNNGEEHPREEIVVALKLGSIAHLSLLQ
jgi:hypothetical protein